MKSLRESIMDIAKNTEDLVALADLDRPMRELFVSEKSPDIIKSSKELIDILDAADLCKKLSKQPTTADVEPGYYIMFGYGEEHDIFFIMKVNNHGHGKEEFYTDLDHTPDWTPDYKRYFGGNIFINPSSNIRTTIKGWKQQKQIPSSNIFLYHIKPSYVMDEVYDKCTKYMKDHPNKYGFFETSFR